MKDRVDTIMDPREHPVLSCDTKSTVASVIQRNLQMSIIKPKEEIIKCVDEEDLPCSETVYTSEPLKSSSEYVNFYDSNSYVVEQPKRDFHDDAYLLQSGCSLNNKVVSGNMELKQEIKHENTGEGSSLNIKQDVENTEYQIEIKMETMEQPEIRDNTGGPSTHDLPLSPQDIQYNFAEKTFKTNFDLLRPINENVKVEINASGDNETNAIYQCQYCDKIFDNYNYMLVHISTVHREKTPKCELCGNQFKTLWNLKRHVQLCHKLQNSSARVTRTSLICKYCNENFKNKYGLNKHRKLCYTRQEDERRGGYACVFCRGVYKSKWLLTRHIKRMHYDSRGKCECWCGRRFSSSILLKYHKRQWHYPKLENANGKFQCDSCQKNFNTKSNLHVHIMRLHYDYGRMFECWCGKEFRSPIRLYEHKREQHRCKIQNTNDTFQCDYCQKCFKIKRNLVNHIKRLHYDYGRTFECFCGKQFLSPISLKRHKHDRKIKKTNYDKFQCDNCQKFYKSKNSLICHIKKLHYDYGRTFICWCGKEFRSPIHLRKHNQRHDRKIQERNHEIFQCDPCQKFFKTKQSLATHVKRIHCAYEKMFKCLCGEQFRSPIRLSQHKRLRHEHEIQNTNNQKFQCDICQKLFKLKQSLAVHILRSHYVYGKLFECWCGKQYRSPIQLNEHKKIKHVLLFGGYKFCL